MKRRIVLFLLIFSSVSLSAGEEEWHFVGETEGVSCYVRKLEGFDIKQCRGLGYVDAPFDVVSRALLNTSDFPECYDMITSAELVYRYGNQKYVVQSRVNFPWPLLDRESLTLVEVHRSDECIIHEIKNLEDHPRAAEPAINTIRIPYIREKYQLYPEGDRTLVIYESISDPGGNLPKEFVNMTVPSLPVNALRAARKLTRLYLERNNN